MIDSVDKQQGTCSRMSGQKNLPASTGQMLHRMLRVNHAGELGADAIYRGQLAVFRSAAGPESKKTSEQIQVPSSACHVFVSRHSRIEAAHVGPGEGPFVVL